MKLLLLVSITLFAGLVFQWLLWSLRIPHRQSRGIVLIFAACTVLGAWCGALVLDINAVTLLYYLTFMGICSLGYLVTYSAVEVDSPSLVMIQMLQERGPRGIRFEEWAEALGDDTLVHPRIADLIRDGHVLRQDIPQGTQLVLTAKGRAFIQIFVTFRRYLAVGKGG